MATITYDDGHVVTIPSTVTTAVTGHGAGGAPVFAVGKGRVARMVTGKLSFDNSYPTGGESVADLFGLFTTLQGMYVQDPTASAGTGKTAVVDYTNQKVMLYTNAGTPAEVANASDQSGAANLRFIAWGV